MAMSISDEIKAALQGRFGGNILAPSDAGFAAAAGIWNGMVARTPGVIVRCASVADVQSAVRAAGALQALTAIRCGGHSLAGFSTCDGGVVIDLCGLRSVMVDADRRLARAGGGCLL